jgi:putative redox protein
MTFTASARQLDGGLRHEVDVNGRHMIVTDEPLALGGTDTGPAPHELLAAMVASCVSTTIALYAARHGWSLAGLRVDCEYDPQVTPRPLTLVIHLPDGLSVPQAERLHRVADTCPVRRALEAGFAFDETFEIEVAPAAA